MKKSLLALTLLVAAPFAASAAEGVSYNYVQGGYAATNTDGADADGWGLDGSVAIAPNFHLFGGYSNQEIDDTSIDFDQWRVGVGYNREIARSADLVTRVAYEKFDAGSGFDYDGEFYGRLGAQAKFNQNWGVSGDVKFVDGDTQWFVGPRFSW